MSRFLLNAIKNLIVLLLFASSVHAQIDWSLSANFVAADAAGGSHLGLAHPIVRDIQEDGKGRMWFATQTGVSCFDGKTFNNYLHSPADSLLWKNWGCHFLTADGAGRIWLATTFRLFYFDEKANRFVEYDLSDIEPTAPKNNWQSEIYLLDFRDEGKVWFRKNEGLYAIDAQKLTTQKRMHLPATRRSVHGVLGKDNDGNLWTGGWEGPELAVFRMDGSIRRKMRPPFNWVTAMFAQKGSPLVWLGTNTLACFDQTTGRWEQWPARNALIRGLKLAPKLSGDSILWMIQVGKAEVLGFNMFSKSFQFQISSANQTGNPLRCGILESLYSDSKSNLWIGGREGVFVVFSSRAEMEKWGELIQKKPKSMGLPSKKPLSGTWKMPGGSLAEWVSFESKIRYIALSKHTKAFFEGEIGDDGSIAGRRIFVDLETGERSVAQLVYRCNPAGDWVELEPGTSASPRLMTPLTGFGNEVVVCRGKKFDPTTDQTGTWSGTDGHTTYYFQDGDFFANLIPDHFPDYKKTGPKTWKGQQSRMYNGCLTEMALSHKWVQTDSVLADWEALDGRCDLKKGQKGHVVVKRLKAMQPGDSVFITEFRIFDKIQSIQPSDFREMEFVIEHAENFISFDFASSADPAMDIAWWYRLDGFDRDWVQTRAWRTATYTNLDGGSYIFRVRATDAEGSELVGNAQFRLRVRLPFYKTWWFISLTLAAFFGLVWLIFQNRLRQRLEKEAIRLRIARDLHDEVGSTLSSISILSQSSLRGVEQDLENARLGNIGDKARAALESISDIVWSVNPQNDSMEKVLARMSAYASEMLENVGAELRFEVGPEVEALSLPMEKRKDFYLIFKEAVHNCAKYARAKRVEVALRKEGNALVMSVKDDGVGFEPYAEAKNMGGNGLWNMRSRAAAMGGSLEVTSEPGAGTEVRLTVLL